MSEFLQRLLRNSRGAQGIYSVCSAHRWVVEAAMRQAQEDDTHLLLEATCNQVNQFGGYTGMTPGQFREYIHAIAHEVGFRHERLILGGDHLGPNPWQHLDAKTAMDYAVEMVRQYVEAGFTKIHLDASMRCADDPICLSDQLMADRAALLCKSAESARNNSQGKPIVYVIGTEVPTPGGASHTLDQLEVTQCDAVERTLAVHREAFSNAGLGFTWSNVIAVVVQPGVEFDHNGVIDYDPSKTRHLQSFLQVHPELVLEAHSSDYQRPEAYQELIRDGFSILKVGPALTFALREALYSLAAMERELSPAAEQSYLVETMEETMLAHPESWQKYYRGDQVQQKFLRIYSYSDRIRYYWGFPEAEVGVTRLVNNLRKTGMPATMLSQYFPVQYEELRRNALQYDPKEIVIARIRSVLKPYSEACVGRIPHEALS
jgi:D-tagatose-1,6-bisphosphate aldolase subunit GatZ/KbaZ